MNAAEVKQVFDKVIVTLTDQDKIARLEIAREYFTNPEFRAALEEKTFGITMAAWGR